MTREVRAVRGTVRSLAVVVLAGVVLPVAAQFIEDGREDRLSGGVKVVSPDARPVGPRTAAEILKEFHWGRWPRLGT